jgi:hypothetical protein
MEIDRRCNLVLTLEKTVRAKNEEGVEVPKAVPYAYVHHTPIDQSTYEMHFFVLHKVVATLYTERMTPAIASRVGMLMLRRVAKETGTTAEVELLLSEIWRRTNVLMATERGYDTIPFVEAMKTMDADDVREVQNYVCFFTAAFWFHLRQEKTENFFPAMIDSGAQIVSSSCTEYRDSLPTLTPHAPTGGTAALSSIPH